MIVPLKSLLLFYSMTNFKNLKFLVKLMKFLLENKAICVISSNAYYRKKKIRSRDPFILNHPIVWKCHDWYWVIQKLLRYHTCFQCNSGLGTRMLFDQLFHEPQKILILGPPCSTDAQSVADTAHHWNLISVSDFYWHKVMSIK